MYLETELRKGKKNMRHYPQCLKIHAPLSGELSLLTGEQVIDSIMFCYCYFILETFQVLEYNTKLDQISKPVKTKRKNYKKLVDSHLNHTIAINKS